MERQENTQYILSLSYGKDSIATIEACRLLGYPIDRIIHAEVWFNDQIPAELPPMVEFKTKADEIILNRYGIQVEHICAMRDGKKLTYEKMFYHIPKRKNDVDSRGGVPNLWISYQLRERKNGDLVQESQRAGIGQGDKKSKDFHLQREVIARNSKTKQQSVHCWGFPHRPRAEWCKELKRDTNRVFR